MLAGTRQERKTGGISKGDGHTYCQMSNSGFTQMCLSSFHTMPHRQLKVLWENSLWKACKAGLFLVS